MNFLTRTNQRWKLYLFVVLMALGAGVTLFQSFLHKLFDKDSITSLVIGGMLLVIGVFVWAYISITCPDCKLRIFWYSISKVGLGTWFPWLINLERCPQCEKLNAVSAPGTKDIRSQPRQRRKRA